MDRKWPEERRKVTPVSDVALAEVWAEALEDSEAKRSGLPVNQIRPTVARMTGVATGKLYSLRRKRLKTITRDVLEGIGEALAKKLQNQLRQIEHDLQIRRQIGARSDSGESLSLERRREKIRTALREALGLPASDGEAR